MKCFRAKLSDRREVVTSPGGGSPGRHCQRRLANSSCDEEDWGKRYTPERYHLETPSPSQNENKSRSTTPSSAKSETTKIFEIRTAKNIFRPAFLTITNLDFPSSMPINESKSWSKRRSKYKMVPKHCSSHMHRMFVKNSDTPSEEDLSRASSRASSEYDGFAFEEYLRGLNLPDDSSDCSLFESAEENNFDRAQKRDDDSTNNNDSQFINKNGSCSSLVAFSYRINADFDSDRDSEAKVPSLDTQNGIKEKKVEAVSNRVSSAAATTYKRDKRKSITLSRIPSPETVQIIRIDVITGYPVDSDNSILSETTDIDRLNSDDNSSVQFGGSVACREAVSTTFPEDSGNEMDYVPWKHILNGDATSGKKNDMSDPSSLLNCKAVNLSNR